VCSGLLVVPGSHKAVFSRPRSLFSPFGNPPGLGGPNRPPHEDWSTNMLQIPVPDGCLHVRPNPGDVVLPTRPSLKLTCLFQFEFIERFSVRCTVKENPCLILACFARGQVIMAETLTHGIRPWISTERPRRALAIRYKTGAAYDEHVAAWQAKEVGGAGALPDWMTRPERLHSGMSFGMRWDAGTLRAASAATLAIIGDQTHPRL
jgi:hypothetical protein